MIAIKTEKTQIHFLSDVLLAVAPLDLKVPIRQVGRQVLFLLNNKRLIKE